MGALPPRSTRNGAVELDPFDGGEIASSQDDQIDPGTKAFGKRVHNQAPRGVAGTVAKGPYRKILKRSANAIAACQRILLNEAR